MEIHYLDNSATTPVCDEAKAAMAAFVSDCCGNPSSMHAIGAQALVHLDEARAAVAKAIGCKPGELYFTSCGSESNNTAVFGAAYAKRHAGRHIVTTAVEHPSVLEAMKRLEGEGFEVTYITPASDGNISPEQVASAVRADTVLVSMMAVNNETGAVMPVSQIKPALKAVGSSALVHCDCVQAFGKIPVRPSALGADLITVSGHKVHAPKGIGALYIAQNVHIRPYIVGGGQERGMRSGTESTLLIEGFAAAVGALPELKGELEKITALRDRAVAGLSKLEGLEFNSPANALPYIINFSCVGIRSEVMMHFLEMKGVYVSGASACARGAVSHVLTAQGLSRSRADSAIRVSLSRFTTDGDIDALISAVTDGLAILKRRK